MITAGTFKKLHSFRGDTALQLLHDALLEVVDAYGWIPHAWAVFSNHYHLIAQPVAEGAELRAMVQHLHSRTAREINAAAGTPGRRVWFQFWDSCITFEKSYFARLSYVHSNPVKHGVVTDPRDYPYCSAAWLEATGDTGLVRKIASFAADRVNVVDDFEVQ